jgi:hypothetical protein
MEPDYFDKTEALLRRYIGDRLLLFKLKATAQSARLASILFIGMTLLLLGFFMLLFLSIMAGYYFGELTGSLFYGFGIITLFYLILLIAILSTRKKYLQPYLTNMVIRLVFDKSEEQENGNENETD